MSRSPQLTFLFTLAAAHAFAIEGARQEIYKKIGEVELAAHIFEPVDHQPSDRQAAAIFFFGGGWNGGTPEQFAPHARYLASRGMVGVVADYRVKSRQETTPFECVKDGKSAIRWLRANATRLGVDPNRIAAGGGSAGGHVAAATGTINGINEKSDDLSVSAVPNALLLFNPVYDNGPGGYGHKQFGDRYREISPRHNIRRGMPPAIVFFGTKDGLVPVSTAKAFQKEMRAVDSQSELFLYEGQPHGFFNHAKFRPQASPVFYYQTMLETDRFLTALDFLAGEPTLKAPEFQLQEDAKAKSLNVTYDGRALAQYVHAFDDSTKESRHETYKPFLHVYDSKGQERVTKGPGGQFTHHRGIFLGYSRLGIGGKRYDLWHMKEGVQVHTEFANQKADAEHATFTSKISWQKNDGEVLLTENRTFTFLTPPAGAYALIDVRHELTAVAGDAEMNGDPEHAGAQFRPANNVVVAETEYVFPQDGQDPKKDLDLPWVGETFRLDSGKAKHSVVIFNHPDNPKNTRFSAYRDYGRFGAFPVFTIPKGQTATLHYRWMINGGKMQGKEAIEKAYAEFTKD